MKLDRTNIDRELRRYLEAVNSMKLPAPQDDVLAFIHSLKRSHVRSGPYPDVSLFEASNRILSDLIVLFGVRQLLTQAVVGHVQLPFTEYEVALSVEGGNDLTAVADGQRLIGEAFNVAPSFFQSKKASMLKRLRLDNEADYRLVIFNEDAVKRPDHYREKSKPGMLYLLVDVWADRRKFMESRYFG